MRSFFLILLCLVCSACTRVAFTVPVGQPASTKDLAELKGDWTGEKGSVWHVGQVTGTDQFSAQWTEDGKAQSREFIVTTLGQETFIIWVKDKELAAYVPLRVAAADEALALLYPDENTVKRLVQEGKLTGVFDEKLKSWTIAEGDWSEVLRSKDFWKIDVSKPFTKIKGPKAAQEPAPSAETPVHEKPVAPAVGAGRP